ncbi:MAG: hypothetical protein K8T90_07490 [Planctomycetes bacterium]|nr:hypothetical protein [Planctomycetota bacterium]
MQPALHGAGYLTCLVSRVLGRDLTPTILELAPQVALFGRPTREALDAVYLIVEDSAQPVAVPAHLRAEFIGKVRFLPQSLTVRAVPASEKFVRKWSATPVTTNVLQLREFDVPVIGKDCGRYDIRKDERKALVKVVSQFAAAAAGSSLGAAITTFQGNNQVESIVQRPDAKSLQLIEAKDHGPSEARLFFCPVSPSQLLLAAVAKAKGGASAQDRAISLAVSRASAAGTALGLVLPS